MTPLLKSEVIQQPLVLAFLILAVIAYRSKRTVPLLLLMLAAICYFLQRIAMVVIALFFWLRGWTLGSLDTWWKSWGPWISQTFSFLFLGLIIAAMVCFIRERKGIATPHA